MVNGGFWGGVRTLAERAGTDSWAIGSTLRPEMQVSQTLLGVLKINGAQRIEVSLIGLIGCGFPSLAGWAK